MNAQPASVTDEQSALNSPRLAVTRCPKCKRPMPPDMPVFYLPCDEVWRAFSPACEHCFERFARSFTDAYAGDINAAKQALLKGRKTVPAFVETPCAECGRSVWKRPRKGNSRVFCSNECATRFYRHEALRNRNSTLNLLVSSCNTCGGAIADKRRGDVRYCSPACRQKAYRQRQQGTVR